MNYEDIDMPVPIAVGLLGIGAKAWGAYSKAKKLRVLQSAKAQGAKNATKVRKARNQPKEGQKEMFKGDAGPNVKRPEGKVQDGWYERATKQLDLFDKKATDKLVIRKHTK
jgi:hypothetical protein